jgi:NADPH:quinone reductase-like Zn-dependent oxidoreductase
MGNGLPAMMRAAIVTALGDADTIAVTQQPLPKRGQSEALVAVDYSAVNQVDTYIRSGAWRTPVPFPFTVGRDLVGTIAEVEPSTGFTGGQHVWCNSMGHAGRQGACAEYVAVPVDRLYPLPDEADPIGAVATFHPAATAYLALHRRADVRPGDTVLIGGAAGSVGSCATRFATDAGATVIATARVADHARCLRLGAAHAFDYAADDVAERITAVAPGGVDVYWDTSGHAELNDVVATLRPGGTIVVTAGRRLQPPTSLWPLYTNDITVTGFVISRATVDDLAHAARAINSLLRRHGSPVEISTVVPLDETARAHQLVESRVRGRVVIAVRDRAPGPVSAPWGSRPA